MKFAYLGPEGTFTEMALQAWRPAAGHDHVAFGSVDAALAALRQGEVDSAMVPIENSVEGGVSATLDALANGDPLVLTGEVLVPVAFVLAARQPMELTQIRAVGTHSHAWAQVRSYAAANLAHAAYVPTLSTAAAAAGLAGSVEVSYDAAVCAPVAARTHGLHILAEDIGDNQAAVTRFVMVSRPGWTPVPTGADKTTVVLYQHHDRPGALLELLEQFSARGINLTRLESRPTGESMGSYCFSIDFEGHVQEHRVGEALSGLKRVCLGVRYLGSYPRADGESASVRPEFTDDAFVIAKEWLAQLRS